jgi:non-heme chloroperoxidase
MWLTHLPAFSSHYRVIAYSRRNHYPNATGPTGTPDYAADVHGTDLAGLVQNLRLGPVNVVAHSAGAHTALFFAARYPALVKSLAIVEPPASGMLTDSPDDIRAAREFLEGFAPALQALRRSDVEPGMRLFADGVGGPGTYDRRTAEQRAIMRDNVNAHVADAKSVRARPIFDCSMASKIWQPVLIISGRRSPAYFHRIVAHLSQCLPNNRVQVIDSSHTVPNENPSAFDRAVLAFLDAQQGIGGHEH